MTWRRIKVAITNAQAVADYFLWMAKESGDLLTNKKLQKLLYYAQGWYLAIHDEPLFDDDFQAWIHGPVQRGVWDRFREHGWNPLPSPVEIEPEIDPKVKSHLEELMVAYGGISAFELVQMTHSERPWLEARGSLPFDTPSSAMISKETMRAFFKGMDEAGNGPNQA